MRFHLSEVNERDIIGGWWAAIVETPFARIFGNARRNANGQGLITQRMRFVVEGDLIDRHLLHQLTVELLRWVEQTD